MQLPARIVSVDLVVNARSRQRRPGALSAACTRAPRARLSVTRSVRVSLRHDDEHVNYYHQGSLAKLQRRPVAIEIPG